MTTKWEAHGNRIIGRDAAGHRVKICEFWDPPAPEDLAVMLAAPVMVAALRKIAAFDDEGGNETLARRGSYSGFDEPGSVEIAREALAAVGLIKEAGHA